MKNSLYNWIIQDATHHCYQNCLDYFGNGSSILDVGIGNGLMLKTYHSLIKSKGLKIFGLDINRSYLDHCDNLIQDYGLNDFVQIRQQPVETYRPPEQNRFDFVLFSMSFMLIADQQRVLDRVKNWLSPEGKIVFFQTVFTSKFGLMEFIKPRLKYLTTIDFGKVTYENEFFDLIETTKLAVVEDRPIRKKWFLGQYRMIVTGLNGSG